jgi:hypothetical protein
MLRGRRDEGGADMSDARQATGAVIHIFEVGNYLWQNEMPLLGRDDKGNQ